MTAPQDMEPNSPSYDHYIKALTEISRAVTSDLFLEDVFKLMVMVVARVTGVDICSLWLIDNDAEPPVLRLKATQAIEPEYMIDRVLGVGEGVVGHVSSTSQPLVIADVLHCDIFKEKEMAQKLGLVSMAGVPLLGKKREVVGVLNCFTLAAHTFSPTDLNLLSAVANQAALAIHTSELVVRTRLIEEELKSRKTIERAKEVVMERLQVNGEEAYRWLRKQSMNGRKTLLEVAEAVLLSVELCP